MLTEPFVINQEDPNVTQADGAAEALQDLFLYRVPLGITILLRPEDVFCLYAEETDTTALQTTAEVKLEVRDATQSQKIPVLGPALYASFLGEFKDQDKFNHLDIAGPVEVKEKEYIAVMVKNPTPYADKDTGYFSLRTHRRRG